MIYILIGILLLLLITSKNNVEAFEEQVVDETEVVDETKVVDEEIQVYIEIDCFNCHFISHFNLFDSTNCSKDNEK